MKNKTALDIFNSVKEKVLKGEFKVALTELRDIQETLDPALNQVELAHLHRWFAAIFYYLGDYTLSLSYSEKAFAANRGPHGDMCLFAKIRQVQATTLQRIGRYDESVEIIEEAVLAFKIVGDSRGQILATNVQGLIVMESGRLLKAKESFDLMAEGISKVEFPDLFSTNILNRSYVRNRLGQFSESVELISETWLAQASNKNRQSWMLAERSFALMHLGRLDEAAEDLSKMYSLATLDGLKRETILYYEYHGLLKLISGELDSAEESFKRALELVPEIAARGDMVSQVNRLLAELSLARAEYEKAIEYGEIALDVARRIPERVEIGASLRCIAEAASELGDKERARECFREALELYEEYPHGYEFAKTRLAAARSGLFDPEETLTLENLAMEYFTSENITLTNYRLPSARICLEAVA